MSSNWSNYLCKGIPVQPGEPIPVRKELRDLSDLELGLYREGLARFQKTAFDDPLSYWQIAGIHGIPYTTWPNQPWNKDIPHSGNQGSGFQGFCTHTSIIFLTWHRPYLALYEAQLQRHMIEIVNGLPFTGADKQQYMNIALSFRLPYWDWARKDATPIFPGRALYSTYVDTGVFKTSLASVKPNWNPLAIAPFPDGTPTNITLTNINGTQNKSTVRYPWATDSQQALESKLTAYYKDQAPVAPGKNLSERAAYILLSYQQYGAMSNDRYASTDPNQLTASAGTWGSVEDIHNAIHNLTGGPGRTNPNKPGGHMTNVPISSFDPIFWMHHANIDRLLAIWQALHENDQNPGTYVTKQPCSWGDFVTKAGDPESADTKLYPFRPTTTSWYTSNDVKRTETFGYSYPETTGLAYPTSTAAKQKLKSVIENEYLTASTMIRDSLAGKEDAGRELLPQAALLKKVADPNVAASANEAMSQVTQLPDSQALLKESLEPSKPRLKKLAPSNKYLEWLVNLKAERHALDGRFSVHIFLGPVEEDDVYLWPFSPHYVGTFAPLGQSSDTGCGRCRVDQEDHTQVTGQIPLTVALLERYLAQMIPDISPETVIPYLAQNLHWRVEFNGTILEDRSQVNGLTVFVISNEVTLPHDLSQLPLFEEQVRIHPGATTKADGSSGRGEGTGLVEGQL